MNRRLLIVAAVIGLHVIGLWALQSGLLRRAVEMVIPVQVMAELIEMPQPEVAPAPPPPEPAPKPQPKPVVKPRPQPKPEPLPVPVAEIDPTPAENAPVVHSAPPPPPLAAPAAQSAPVAPAVPTIELPSSTAAYLNNPAPRYPPLSRRLGEQGRVMVRVLIEPDGSASQAEIRRSSGYSRLDQTALETVLKWRYSPGKRAGVPEAMWFTIPIDFVLE